MRHALPPVIWCLLGLNLFLQVFDGIVTYHAVSLGVPEQNPFVRTAIVHWGAGWGLMFWKALACALLGGSVTLSKWHRVLAVQALTLTGTIYGCCSLVPALGILLHWWGW
jgi:Domain of unknown function (DUF5658)